MVHALAGLDKPVPDWVYILVFGGPVALVSLVWWMGKRGWIKVSGGLSGDEDERYGSGGRGGESDLCCNHFIEDSEDPWEVWMYGREGTYAISVDDD